MFHVLLALPAIAVFGTVAGAVLSVLGVLLGLAFLIQLLSGFIFRSATWLLWLPGVLGLVILGILGAGLGTVPLVLMLAFGIVYGVVLLAGKCVAALLSWLLGLIF